MLGGERRRPCRICSVLQGILTMAGHEERGRWRDCSVPQTKTHTVELTLAMSRRRWRKLSFGALLTPMLQKYYRESVMMVGRPR